MYILSHKPKSRGHVADHRMSQVLQVPLIYIRVMNVRPADFASNVSNKINSR